MRLELVVAVVVALRAGPAAPPPTSEPLLPPGHPAGTELRLRLEALERLETGDAAGAVSAARALVEASPRSSDGWRFAAFLYRGLGRWEEAEGALGEAVRWAPDASSAAGLLAERAEVRKARGQLEAAEDDVRTVLGVWPAHPLALQLGVEVALARGGWAEARARLQALEGAAGRELPLMRARVLEAEGDGPGALAWARKAARQSGPQDGEAAGLVARLEERVRAERTAPVVRALGGLGLLLAGLVGMLAAVALPLARRERRRLLRAGLVREGRVREGRVQEGLPRGGRLAGAALRAAAGGMAALVLLLPVVVLAPLAWPLAALLALGPRPEWLLLLVGLGAPALATCVGWARALGARPLTGELGPALLPERQPRLFAELAEAARAAHAPPPARVHLAPDAALHAFEAGPLWRLLLGRGEWTLVVGLARLVGTPRGELRALLVDALGAAGGGGLLRAEARTALALRHLGEALHAQPLALVNPFYHALALLADLYQAVRDRARPALRAEVELRAARAAGGAALVTGRARGAALRRRHDRVANRLVPALVRAGHPVADLYRLLAACEEVLPPAAPTPPPVADEEVLPQGALLGVERAGAPPPEADTPAVGLLEEASGQAQALTRAWVARLARGLAAVHVAVAPPAPPASPAREVARGVALARFDEALALRRAGAGGAEEAVQGALAALEDAVGPRDALLGLALKELAVVEALRGERACAVRTLERALQAEGGGRFRALLEEWRRVA